MKKLKLLIALVPTIVLAQYDRSDYGTGWPSVGNGCTVRTYVLAKFSINKVGCKDVKKGVRSCSNKSMQN